MKQITTTSHSSFITLLLTLCFIFSFTYTQANALTHHTIQAITLEKGHHGSEHAPQKCCNDCVECLLEHTLITHHIACNPLTTYWNEHCPYIDMRSFLYLFKRLKPPKSCFRLNS